MAKRKMPKDVAMGRAGLYTAPVDTVGMDPDQKAAMGVGQPKPKPKKKGIIASLKSKMGISY